MAIQISFDSVENVLSPTIVLTYKSGKKIGALLPQHLHYSESVNSFNEISFDVYKVLDGVECPYWSKISDFKLIYCVEWDTYFEIYVEVDESNETVKHIQGRSLAEAELSQIKIYGLEVNTENDIARSDYSPTIFYSSDPNSSLLHKLLEKTPNFEIGHVDYSIGLLQRTFTFDGDTIYDAMQNVAEEVKCLFEFVSRKGDNNTIDRVINVYDLSPFCDACGKRYIEGNTCPKCGGTRIIDGYGEDTSIFVSNKNLTDQITCSVDADGVKNCFKLTAGDDLMTATIRNCSPGKSGYLWHFTEDTISDMSDELKEVIMQYKTIAEQYNTKFNDGDINYCDDWNSIITSYNNIVNNINALFADKDIGMFDIPNNFENYSDIMNSYYNAIDFELFLKNGMMPSSIDYDKSEEELLEDLKNNLTKDENANGSHDIFLPPDALDGYEGYDPDKNDDDNYLRSLVEYLESYFKKFVSSVFRVEITEGSFVDNVFDGIISLIPDNKKTAGSSSVDLTSKNINITASLVSANSDSYSGDGYAKQKLESSLVKIKDDIPDVINLFSSECSKKDFESKIKYYGLIPLTRLRDAGQGCLNILIDIDTSKYSEDIYRTLYDQYREKVNILDLEIEIRQSEINVVSGTYNANGQLYSHGVLNCLDDIISDLQKKFDLESFIINDQGDNALSLLQELVSYRREDEYKNDNFISDGLNNSELFKRAMEFIEEAEREIRLSSSPTYSIETTLNNLLVMKEFKPIVNKFSTGNWIRVDIDSDIYKLRLIKYDIDFDDLKNIQVEVSDVQNIKDSVADIQSVLSQATSIASNYSNIKVVANKGKKASEYVMNWVNDGLSLTNTKIVSSANNQSVYWDENGLLCREYSPILNAYNKKQLKIINKGLYLTDNNWENVKVGIGSYIYFDPFEKDESKKYKEGYGVIADTLVGNLILSESVGIYNKNNSVQINEDGFVVTVRSGTSNDVFHIQKETESSKYDTLFKVDSKGDLFIKGHIEATTLKLGNKNITNDDFDLSLDGYLLVETYNEDKGTMLFRGSSYSGVTENGTDVRFEVSTNGLLTAENAVISGTIRATGGEFVGDLKSGFIYDGWNFQASNDTVNIGRQSDGSYAMTVNSVGQITLGRGVTLSWDDLDGTDNVSDSNLRDILGLKETESNSGEYTICPHIKSDSEEISMDIDNGIFSVTNNRDKSKNVRIVNQTKENWYGSEETTVCIKFTDGNLTEADKTTNSSWETVITPRILTIEEIIAYRLTVPIVKNNIYQNGLYDVTNMLNKLDDLLKNVPTIENVYPIGSIYITTNNENPEITFGFGTWVQWGSGRVPVGYDALDTDFRTVENTGGSKTHTLTVDEIPSHSHTASIELEQDKLLSGSDYSRVSTSGTNTSGIISCGNTGGGQPHNNMPPYIVCYMWKRIR